MAIRIHTLGTQRVEQDGRVLDRLPAQRVRLGVLVFIAVEREVSRDRVLGMFWADRPPERARHALSQTLYELRQELGDDVVRTVGETLAIGHHVAVDVHDFAEAVEAEDYRAALSLYGGRFLAGANLSGSRELEGWIDGQESRIHRLHRKARRGAISAALEAGAAGEALSLAREWAETDPLDDEAQHRVIELMADEGDRAGALRQYERYARLMEEELELEPLDETRELVEQIRASDAGAPPLGTTEPRPESGPRSGPEPRSEPKPSPGPEPRPEPVPAPRAERGREAHQTTSPSRIDRALEVPERRPVAARRTGWAAAVLILVLGAGGLWFVLGGWSSSSDRQGLDPRRIAVLFFDDHSPSQELGPAAAGFTEALIHELDQVSGLEILSRTAVEAYRREKPPMDSIVKVLKAGTLVEGSLTTVGDSIRVTFQLIDGETATHLLSGTVSRPAAEIAVLARDLPREVARKLRQRLGSEIVLREARRGTDVAEAWLLVQRAQVLMEDEVAVFREDVPAGLALLERADSMLGRAEALDPDWPEPTLRRARVAMARARRTAAIPGEYEVQATREAVEHLARVLERDPNHAGALETRGILRFELAEAASDESPERVRELYRLAESDLRTAVELDSQRARAWWGLSRLLRRKSSFAEAKRAARRALAADAFLEVPAGGLFQLFHTSFEKEEHAEAVEWCDALRQRYPENVRRVQCELMLMASSPRVDADPARGWALADTMVAMGSQDAAESYSGWAALYVAKILARTGQPDSARSVLARIVSEPPPEWAAYDAAHLSLLLGDREEALRLLAHYVQDNPGEAPSLSEDWWFRPLHGDPRFTTLVAGTGTTREP